MVVGLSTIEAARLTSAGGGLMAQSLAFVTLHKDWGAKAIDAVMAEENEEAVLLELCRLGLVVDEDFDVRCLGAIRSAPQPFRRRGVEAAAAEGDEDIVVGDVFIDVRDDDRRLPDFRCRACEECRLVRIRQPPSVRED